MRKLFGLLIVLLFVVSGCGSGNMAADSPPAALPTFTPTAPVVATPVDPAMAATAQAEATQLALATAALAEGQAVVSVDTPRPNHHHGNPRIGHGQCGGQQQYECAGRAEHGL